MFFIYLFDINFYHHNIKRQALIFSVYSNMVILLHKLDLILLSNVFYFAGFNF